MKHEYHPVFFSITGKLFIRGLNIFIVHGNVKFVNECDIAVDDDLKSLAHVLSIEK